MTNLERLIITLAIGIISQGAFAAANGVTIYQNSCNSCHGEAAVGMATPVIHGLPTNYITQELNNYKNGKRHDVTMNAMNNIATDLDADAISSVATYVNSLNPCSLPSTVVSPGLGDANAGRATAQSHSCLTCHTVGNSMKAPVLDGEKTQYIVNQLNAFRTGARKVPLMNSMTASLSDRDINDIAAYFNSQRHCQ